MVDLLKIQNIDGETILHTLIRQNKYRTLTDDIQDRTINLLGKISKDDLAALLKIKDKDGDTLIHSGLKSNSPYLVEKILEKVPPTDLFDILEIKNNIGDTVPYLAIKEKHIPIVLKIVKALPEDALVKIALMLHGDKNNIFLFSVIGRRYPELALSIINKISSSSLVDILKVQNKIERDATVLHLAFDRKYQNLIIEIFKKIQKEAHWVDLLKIQDTAGDTVLHMGIQEELIDLFLNILKNVAKADRAELLKIENVRGFSVILQALLIDRELFLEALETVPKDDLADLLLLEKIDGTMISLWTDQLKGINERAGDTILHRAIEKDHIDLAIDLLELVPPEVRAEILKIKNRDGDTILHLAIKKDHIDLALNLLELVPPEVRAEILKIKNRDGDTILHLAIKKDHIDLALNLLKLVPEENRKDLLKSRNDEDQSILGLTIVNRKNKLFLEILEKIDDKDLLEIIDDLDINVLMNLPRAEFKRGSKIVAKEIALRCKKAAKVALPYVMLSAALGAVIYLKHLNTNEEEL